MPFRKMVILVNLLFCETSELRLTHFELIYMLLIRITSHFAKEEILGEFPIL